MEYECICCSQNYSNIFTTNCSHHLCHDCIAILYKINKMDCPYCTTKITNYIIKIEDTTKPENIIEPINIKFNNTYVFARNYNILRISHGMAGISYSN